MKHSWKFISIGGVDQVVLRDGEDIKRISELDQKLWMALAVPTRGVEFDPKTADLIDTDADGKIRPPELLTAIKWTTSALKDVGDIIKGGDTVKLSAIKDPAILAGAKRILANLNKPNEEIISLSDVSDTFKIMAETTLNGDGIVTPESAEDSETKNAIVDIVSIFNHLTDRCGKLGIDASTLDKFFEEAVSLSDWASKEEKDFSTASNAIKAIKVKMDDYFARCKLAAFDIKSIDSLNRSKADYTAIASDNLTISDSRLAAFPLAKIETSGILSFTDGNINPAWEMGIANFIENAVKPLLGTNKTTFTESDWIELQSKVASYDTWIAAKPVVSIEKLGLSRINELINSSAKEKITKLIEKDLALEAEFNQMASVTKLIRFQKDLFTLLKNFVNFFDFYGKKGALFQTGTLYLDNRSCNLCISVTDAAKHANLAGMAGMYLAYCNLTRLGGEKQTIAAVFSDGDSDNLMEGRNGVFYDRKGVDWDATIVKVISNPISVREAFWSPYKKFVRMVEEQVAKRAAASNAEADSKLASTAAAAINIDKSTPTKTEPKKIDIGTVAALGVAFGAISTAIAALSTGLMGLKVWQMAFVPLGIMMLISGPSMLIAALKLRKRNLGPILDANGWAINNVARINVLFGASLTGMPELPDGSTRSLKDPYAEKSKPWLKIAIILLILFISYKLLDRMGYIDMWLDSLIQKKAFLLSYMFEKF